MRITANQVTAARLLLMPLLCGLVYGDEQWRLVGVVVGTLIGLTDLVDGWLARKQGPTVLGGLMDPVADKVFITCCFIPFADRGWAPWWFVAALLCRELLVTALRSCFEARGKRIPSDYVAKVKTWVQMAGYGLLILAPILSRTWTLALLGFISGGLAVASVVWRIARGSMWRGGVVGAVSFAAPLLVCAFGSLDAYVWAVMAAILGITWVSAWPYFVAAVRELVLAPHAGRSQASCWNLDSSEASWRSQRGGGRGFDLVRVAGAIAVSLLGVAALGPATAASWALIALLGTEFALHGLDNLLAHHGKADDARVWGGRLAGEAALLGAALLWPAWAAAFAVAALALAVAGAAISFYTHRALYWGGPVNPSPRPAPQGAPQTGPAHR
ncbi:MAG: CDP-alcohol phosphatidyltransferase family protein [Polyangiaceae bacterium]